MTWTTPRCPAASTAAALLLLLAASGTTGCGLLDVSDPTAIEDDELNNATGADLLRRDALRLLYVAVGEGALLGGHITDEFQSNPLFGIRADERLVDQRQSQQYEALWLQDFPPFYDGYAHWQEVRRAATLAMVRLRSYAPAGAARAYVGEMLAVSGFAVLRLAEDVCPGFPLHDVVDFKPVYGSPLSTDEALQHALADLDSALVYAADSARILNLAQVWRARALLGLGRFTEAAAAAPVATSYVRNAEYSSTTFENPMVFLTFGLALGTVADQEGGTGLDFVAAGDPRVETTLVGTADDGVTDLYAAAKYLDVNAPIVLASGVEARLIEAEAALQADPGSGVWLTILNMLRTDGTQDADGVYNPGTGGVAGLAPLEDPGSVGARVDLLFRERAFWLFGTGHRLGDLRRLVSRYGRTSETVFPTGSYWLGGVYGTATSIPFPAALEAPYNPAVTGCTSR